MMITALIREPLTVFSLVGLLLFATYGYLDSTNTSPVRLPPDLRELLIDNFEAVAGRSATAEDIHRLQQEFLTDELLFREALAQGLHLTSGEVRGDLIADMRMQIIGIPPEPGIEALVNYYAENMQNYYSEPAISFTQVFFENEPQDAATLLNRLNAGEDVTGERYWQGADFPDYSHSMIRGMFGTVILDALVQGQNGVWQGPLQSSRGWHFVRSSDHIKPALLSFDQVRTQVENDYLVAVINEAIAARSAELALKFGVEIEP